MIMKTLQAHFDGKVFVPDEPVDLPTGRALQLQVTDVGPSPRRSKTEIQDMLRSLVPIPPEDAREFERILAEANQPADYRGIFDEE